MLVILAQRRIYGGISPSLLQETFSGKLSLAPGRKGDRLGNDIQPNLWRDINFYLDIERHDRKKIGHRYDIGGINGKS